MKDPLVIGDATLYLADYRDLLPLLSGVGAVVTDPPYGIGYSSHRTFGEGDAASWSRRPVANDHDTAARDDVLRFARRLGLPWACFGSWKSPRPDGCRGVLVWDKGPAFGMGDLSFPWKASWEEVYVGGPGWSGERDEGVLRGHLVHSHESQGRRHPNEKPISLMREIVRKLPPGVVVLDPFMGTGPTVLACLMERRPCVGVEIDPVYYDVARERVSVFHGRPTTGLFAAAR